MTNKQIESIKTVCGMTTQLIYTASYRVSAFDVLEEPNRHVKVRFQIERKFGDNEKVFQEGIIYIKPSGALYYLNYLNNPKRVTTIQSVVGPFYGLEDSQKCYGFFSSIYAKNKKGVNNNG